MLDCINVSVICFCKSYGNWLINVVATIGDWRIHCQTFSSPFFNTTPFLRIPLCHTFSKLRRDQVAYLVIVTLGWPPWDQQNVDLIKDKKRISLNGKLITKDLIHYRNVNIKFKTTDIHTKLAFKSPLSYVVTFQLYTFVHFFSPFTRCCYLEVHAVYLCYFCSPG